MSYNQRRNSFDYYKNTTNLILLQYFNALIGLNLRRNVFDVN